MEGIVTLLLSEHCLRSCQKTVKILMAINTNICTKTKRIMNKKTKMATALSTKMKTETAKATTMVAVAAKIVATVT